MWGWGRRWLLVVISVQPGTEELFQLVSDLQGRPPPSNVRSPSQSSVSFPAISTAIDASTLEGEPGTSTVSDWRWAAAFNGQPGGA